MAELEEVGPFWTPRTLAALLALVSGALGMGTGLELESTVGFVVSFALACVGLLAAVWEVLR